MGRRLDFQELLELELGSSNVYFQPPASMKVAYPCIIYHLSTDAPKHANNILYLNTKAYQVIYIDRAAESSVPDKLVALPLSKFDRYYASDNLNHHAYTIYF